MAATSYYNPVSQDPTHQHLLSPALSSFSSGQPSPIKPMHLIEHNERKQYHNAPVFQDFEHLKVAQTDDVHLKARIRRLRLLSRVLAFVISVAVLVPITMTLAKFLSTKNTYRDVTALTGEKISRTAWAHDSKTWPTFVYFGVAAISVLLNFGTVFSYMFGVEQANAASHVASVFSWIIMVGNFVVWTVAASMYRLEKNRNGHSNDLWGWTCSAGARAIQKEFAGEVDFDQYCTVQGVSFYIGVVQAIASLLTVIINILTFMRARSKKNLKHQLRLSGFETAQM
ncbi:Nn.00g051570.m01.CDS01 [Neocucurbitaria sp. VM-36]